MFSLIFLEYLFANISLWSEDPLNLHLWFAQLFRTISVYVVRATVSLAWPAACWYLDKLIDSMWIDLLKHFVYQRLKISRILEFHLVKIYITQNYDLLSTCKSTLPLI